MMKYEKAAQHAPYSLLFQEAGSICFKDEFDFVSNASERIDEFFALALGVWRVFETPVVTINHAWESRAGLVGVAAYCNDSVDTGVEELVKVFRAVSRHVDAKLGHHFDGLWVHVTGRFCSSGVDFRCVAKCVAQDAFRHVAAAGVTGTED